MSNDGSRMSHVDDGTLNALLDGELAAEAAAAVEAHIAVCPECARRLAEAKRFIAEASDLLGALDLPGAVAAPAPRVPKTAKEIALDLDAATQRSPALGPGPAVGAPERTALRPPPRRRLDFTTLAWAATVVLAIGVGYLANEVRHSRERIAFGEGYAGRPVEAARPSSPAAQAPAAPAVAQNAVEPAAGGAARTQLVRGPQVTRAASNESPQAAAASPTRKRTPVLGGKQLAAATPSERAAARLQPERPGKTVVDMVGGVSGAAERQPAAVAAEAPAGLARADRNAPAAGERGAVTVARDQRLTVFRPADLEEAASRLGGTVRLIDGLRIDHVEVGPGWRVAGAAPSLDVVRTLYIDLQGRRVVLDQQHLAQPEPDTVAAERQGADVGMALGDTLTTEAPDGQVQVRWVDRERFWLSLTANLPADSVRALIGRVR